MADQQHRPEPDHSEDPREKEVGEGGYAEEQPGDAGGGAGTEEGTGDDEATERAPSTSSPSESEPGEASGNPGAAGGS